MNMARIDWTLLIFAISLPLGTTDCGGDGGSGADAGNTGPCSGAYNQAWPNDDAAEFCMLPWDATKPEMELTLCGEVGDNCSESGSVPDFSCLDNPGAPPADPAMVTLTGFVDVFSSGPNSNKARIQVFRANQLDGVDDPDTVTPMAQLDVVLDTNTLVDARACPKSTDFMQGDCVVPTNDCGSQCDKVIGAGSFCYQTTCVDLQRWEIKYSIPNIPTNEFLIIRTVGIDDQGNPQVTGNTWAPMLQYNVFLATNDRACADDADRDCIDTTNAIYQSDVNLLSSQDYTTIPTSAGLSAGITPGNGAIAGEIHDCSSVRIQHAQIGFQVGRTPRVLVFFNGNPVKTLPRLQQAQLGTNTLSLYSGLDLAPGDIELNTVGVSNGALKDFGRFQTKIWPDSVTLLRMGGGRPPQH